MSSDHAESARSQQLFAALRKGDHADFRRALAEMPAAQLEQANLWPYAD